ncbi:MAG: crotonase/enoyl-CoA hydratase family protein [Candidatus Wenzhouxiangella sp. M2_3B_020]
MSVQYEVDGEIVVITIDRPERKNAVDAAAARELDARFVEFDRDERLRVAVLTGAGDTFCAGADLRALAAGEDAEARLDMGETGPMGPTRRTLSKPVIAAVEGHSVAGGLELACWCDLRVAARSAVFGVYCRDVGVPLVDGGTVRLPRLIGHSRAMDMILTGRAVDAQEALGFGLVNRLVDDGTALGHAIGLARELADKPLRCLAGDRLSALEQWSLNEADALHNELRHGRKTIRSGESLEGARRFFRGED